MIIMRSKDNSRSQKNIEEYKKAKEHKFEPKSTTKVMVKPINDL